MGGAVYGSIPTTSIGSYAARVGITDLDALARFERMIAAMDGPDVISWNEKANRKST